MPETFNGIGTGVVRASRIWLDGPVQRFDAILAVVVFGIPIVPYRVIHLLAWWEAKPDEHIPYMEGTVEAQGWHSLHLRFRPKIILKAYLRTWSLAAVALGIIGLFYTAMSRWVNDDPADPLFGLVMGTIAGFGLIAWLAWWVIDNRDDRLRRHFIHHPGGASDPCDWPRDFAKQAAAEECQAVGATTLAHAAERHLQSGNRAKACLCVRIAEAIDERGTVLELAHRLWNEAPPPASSV